MHDVKGEQELQRRYDRSRVGDDGAVLRKWPLGRREVSQVEVERFAWRERGRGKLLGTRLRLAAACI